MARRIIELTDIQRALTPKFIQALLKKPLQLFKGAKGWWVRLRTGKAIFIKEGQVKSSILYKEIFSKGGSKKSLTTSGLLDSHIFAHYNSIKAIIKEELGVDTKVADIVREKLPAYEAGRFYSNSKKIGLDEEFYDVIAGFRDKNWWDVKWKSKNRPLLATLEEYQLDAVYRNTKIWNRYVDGVNTLLHESIHSINWDTKALNDPVYKAVVGVEEGLTTYLSNKYTHRVILDMTTVSPSQIDLIYDINAKIHPSYEEATRFVYQSAHLIQPDAPHRFLVELKNMAPQERVSLLIDKLVDIFDEHPELSGTMLENVEKIYSSKGFKYDELSLNYKSNLNTSCKNVDDSLGRWVKLKSGKNVFVYNVDIERGVLKEGIKKGIAALQSLLKRPLQWFQGMRGWWIRTRQGKAVFINEAKVVDPLEVIVKGIRWGREVDKKIYQELFGSKTPRELIESLSPPGMNVISDIDVDGKFLKVFIRNEENTFRMLREFEFGPDFKIFRVHHSGLYNESTEISNIIGDKKVLKYVQSLGWSDAEVAAFMNAAKVGPIKFAGTQIKIPNQLKLIKEDIVYNTNNFKALIRKQLALYDKLGIPEISLRAISEGRGKDTFGGYVWAKYGFDFIDDVERLRVEREFKTYLATFNYKYSPTYKQTSKIEGLFKKDVMPFTLTPGGTKLKLEEIFPFDPKNPNLSYKDKLKMLYSGKLSLPTDPEKLPDFYIHLQPLPVDVIDSIEISTARDIANWTFMDKEAAVPYGKMFLLEAQWEAKLFLTPPDNPQRIIFEEYIGYSKGGK